MYNCLTSVIIISKAEKISIGKTIYQKSILSKKKIKEKLELS